MVLATDPLQKGLFEDIADGLRNAEVMVAFVSDEYAKSTNCSMEFRFATSVLKIPVLLAVVGKSSQWRKSEVLLMPFINHAGTSIYLRYIHVIDHLLNILSM